MAGISISLFKSIKPSVSLTCANSSSCHFSKLRFLSLPRTRKMAPSEILDHSPEIEGPAPKVPKLHQNGEVESGEKEPAPFFRVVRLSKKAVLPSRASPLSAGYDLSR